MLPLVLVILKFVNLFYLGVGLQVCVEAEFLMDCSMRENIKSLEKSEFEKMLMCHLKGKQ